MSSGCPGHFNSHTKDSEPVKSTFRSGLTTLALACLSFAPSLTAQQVWVPLTPGVPPSTSAEVVYDEVVYDEAASSATDSFFDIIIHGFWQEDVSPGNGQTYQQLDVAGLGYINQLGAPDLPVARLNLAVSTDASLVTLASLTDLDPHVFDLRPYPVGTEELDGNENGATPSQFVLDDVIYGGTSAFPSESATGSQIPSLALNSVRSARHEVYPARWDPTTGLLSMSGHLRVHYVAPGQVVPQPAMTLDRAVLSAATFPNWPGQRDYFPADTIEYQGRYLIVASKFDVPVMADFIAKKKSQGLKVDILELQDLPVVSVGEIRGAMAAWYDLGDPADDHYALLVGDDHRIPVADAPTYSPSGTDDLYGSPSDGDLDEEIYVGRISHNDGFDLKRQLDKIIDYMEDQDGDHYDQALLVAAKQGAPGRYVASQNAVAEGLYASAPNFTKIYGLGLVNQSFHIVNSIDAGKGVVAYRGHGSRTSWWNWNVYSESFDRPDVVSLDNEHEPTVVWSITCDTAKFDSNDQNNDSFAETWLEQDKGGAVAVYGSTEISSSKENDLLVKYLFKAVYDYHITRHGQAIAWAEAQMHADRPGMNSWRYMLCGDPSMRIRVYNPIDLEPGLPEDIAAAAPGEGQLTLSVSDGQGGSMAGLLVSAFQNGPDGFQVNGYTDAFGYVVLQASPDAHSGPVQVVVADGLGNEVSISVPVTNGAWTDFGGASTGSFGVPYLTGDGTLAANSPYGLEVTGAYPSSQALLFVSLASQPVSFKGLTLQAFPIAAQFDLGTDATGAISLGGTWRGRCALRGTAAATSCARWSTAGSPTAVIRGN
ncbi:MAG: hypothetical protein ACI9EF_003196 [Pseudohongiellaceae bacterium]|jgi:hypothetical protein